MTNKNEPTPEHIEDALKVINIIAETSKSFGDLGFSMGRETTESIADFLAARDADKSEHQYESHMTAAGKRIAELEAALAAMTKERDEYQRLWHREAAKVRTYTSWQPSDPGTKEAMEWADTVVIHSPGTGHETGHYKPQILADALRAAMVRLEEAEKRVKYMDEQEVGYLDTINTLESQLAALTASLASMTKERDYQKEVTLREVAIVDRLKDERGRLEDNIAKLTAPVSDEEEREALESVKVYGAREYPTGIDRAHLCQAAKVLARLLVQRTAALREAEAKIAAIEGG